MITNHQADVLRHTSINGRFVTDDPRVIEMASQGLLFDFGSQRLAGGMHYLTTTRKGTEALIEWHAAQPNPKIIKHRRSKSFESWQHFCDAFGKIPFSRFWKEIWPTYKLR